VFHLLRFVEEVNWAQLPDETRKSQHREDIEFLQRKSPDPSVSKLRKLRHKLLAHSNINLVKGGVATFGEENALRRFLNENGLRREEIQSLIDKAFSILERWKDQYNVRTSIQKLARECDDYKFVLDSLKHPNDLADKAPANK